MTLEIQERTDQPNSPAAHRGVILGVLALGQLMVVLDTTIVNVALPSIQASLHFASAADLQWVVTAYVLTFGGFLLLGGRVADRAGRRRAFVVGALTFGAASMAGGLAGSAGVLVSARAVQGLGAALMAPAALGLVTVSFAEGEQRNRALGVWAAIGGAGGAIGLLAGGELTTALSWRWVLFVNVPIGILAAVGARQWIAESSEPGGRHFDVGGAITATTGLAALVFALVRANVWGWSSPRTIVVFVFAGAVLALFARLQTRKAAPLVPSRLLRSPTVAGANLGMLLAGAAIFAVFFFLTLYMQTVRHYSALHTGLSYLPISAMIITSAAFASKMLSRIGPRLLLVPGFLLAATGLALLTRVSPDASYYGVVLPAILLIGAGLGAAFVTITSSAVTGAAQDDAGVASALLNASQQIGGSLGLAALTAVATSRFHAIRPSPATPAAIAAATTNSWGWAFAVAAALVFCAAITSAVLVRSRSSVTAS
jgi:EmrB/QacA subfamily drug resistance transporter